VKFGGDSGAVRQVSDIGGGFGRLSFTVRSPSCHAIFVKREIIAARHPADQRRGRNRPRSRPAFSTPEFSTWVRRMRVSRICGRFGSPRAPFGRGDRNRRESRLIRPPRDTSDRACDRVRPVFSKKQENTGDNGLKRARETCSLAVGCRWTSSGSGGMNARPAYLRGER